MYRRHLQGWMKHFDFILLDILLMELSFFLAYFFRHNHFTVFESVLYRESALLILVSGFFASILAETHRNILKRGWWKEFKSVCILVSLTSVVLLAYIFFFRHDALFSRSVFGYFIIISVILLYFGNLSWKKVILVRNIGNHFNQNHMLVVTHSASASAAITRIIDNNFGNYEVSGVVLIDDAVEPGNEIEGVPIVCKYADLDQYMQNKWVDEVMIWLPREITVPEELLNKCLEMGITTHTRLSVDNERNCQQTVEKYAGTTVLTESLRIASNRQIFVKRLMDIVGAVIGLLFTIIFTVIIGPIIFFTDPGPIFFSQERVGKNGRVFRIYKFRSMYKDAETRKAELIDQNKMKGLMFKIDSDPRILGSGPDGTKKGIGWFIRKTSIDEFPQFWNVLKGEMSLVGTRPPTLDEWTQYEAHHRARMAVRPGLTGLWQVSGRSDIQDFEEVINLDMQYINNWNIGMDIKLILKTIGVVFSGRGAE